LSRKKLRTGRFNNWEGGQGEGLHHATGKKKGVQPRGNGSNRLQKKKKTKNTKRVSRENGEKARNPTFSKRGNMKGRRHNVFTEYTKKTTKAQN